MSGVGWDSVVEFQVFKTERQKERERERDFERSRELNTCSYYL